MRLRGLRIQQRIALPFGGLLVAVTLLVAWVSVALISGALDQRLERRLDHVSRIVSERGFGLNAAILAQLGDAVGAGIVTFRPGGEVLVSTLDAEQQRAIGDRLVSEAPAGRVVADAPAALRTIEAAGFAYRVGYRSLRSPSDALVAVILPTSDIAAAKQAITRSIALVALVAIAVTFLLGQWIARGITRPVGRLVASTRSLAARKLEGGEPAEAEDEIGELVTAFNEMVQRLRASERELVRAEKLAITGQLAARVAHDIRNPLSSIKMQAQLLRGKLPSGTSDTSGSQSLEAILREIDRVEWVVGGLLDLSRPRELRRVKTDPNALLRDVLDATEPMLRHRKIELETRLANGLPAISLDPEQLANGLRNLIANAADAMPAGGRLCASTRRSGDATLEIEIRDFGGGIAPEVADQVFDPFFTTRPDGVGLGLLNTRSVVERHAGQLRLEPAEGGGTCARILLPIGADT